uniref:myosin light chain kinase 3-like isoform X2 n=1 Tax=Pristiophorus japonicus TaxID=55135 RepID=UPI00398F7351
MSGTEGATLREALLRTLAAVAESVKEVCRRKAGGDGEVASSGTGVGGRSSGTGKAGSSDSGMGKEPSITGKMEPSGTGMGGTPSITGKMEPSGTGMGGTPSITGKMEPSGTGMGGTPSITGKMEPSGTGMGGMPSITGKMEPSGTAMSGTPLITGKMGSSDTGMGKAPLITGKMGSSDTGMGKEALITGKTRSSGTGIGTKPPVAGKMEPSGTGMGSKPSITGKMEPSGTAMGGTPLITGKMGPSGTGMGKESSIIGKMISSGTKMGKEPSIIGKTGSSGSGMGGTPPATDGTDPSDRSPAQQPTAAAKAWPVPREARAMGEVTARPEGSQEPGARTLVGLVGPASVTEGGTARAGGPTADGGSQTPQRSQEGPNESVRAEGSPGPTWTAGQESGEQPRQRQRQSEQNVPIVDDSPPPSAPFEHRIVSTKPFLVTSYYDVDYKCLLGGGRFGQVYKCQEKLTGLVLASKVIQTKGVKEKEVVKNEINVMNHLHHVNLLQLYDAFEARNNITLIMEYVDGGELFDRILELEGKMTELDAAIFTKQICDGIQYMHSNYVLHLDLKPENILCVSPNTNQIKIIDYGLARRYKPREKLKVNFGTPEFISPEVINYDFVSFPTDMWGLGVIVYMMVSGLSPFLGDNDTETMNNVVHCNWTFDDECFGGTSDEAKEFIQGLLIKERRSHSLP